MLQDSEEACAVWAAAKLASARVPLQQIHGWRVEYKLRGVDSGNGGRTGDMYCFPPEQLLPHEGEAGLGAAGQGSRRVVRSLTAHRSPLTFHPHPNPHPNLTSTLAPTLAPTLTSTRTLTLTRSAPSARWSMCCCCA